MSSQHSHSRGKTPSKDKNEFKKVKLFIRIRPFLEHESNDQVVTILNDETLQFRREMNQFALKFDQIFAEDCTQHYVHSSVHFLIDQFIAGSNSTIFAYGQTGAGKTHTIMGRGSEPLDILQGEDRGLLPRAIESLFDAFRENEESKEYKCWMSFYEVYNEKIYDLFNMNQDRSGPGLEVREDKSGEVHIPELLQIEIMNEIQAFGFLSLGLKNRIVADTQNNKNSSRSHSIFQFTLAQRSLHDDDDPIVISKLRIVDLAGSEKYRIPKYMPQEEKEMRLAELTSINGSLSALGHCISALTDQKRTHIPFRNSKLTRVLRDSLNGQGLISIVVCISPSLSSAPETLSTLQFADRAKKAIIDGRHLQAIQKRKPKEGGSSKSRKELELLAFAYEHEKNMRQELEAFIRENSHSDMERELLKLRLQNLELKKKLNEFETSQTPRTQQRVARSLSPMADMMNHGGLRKRSTSGESPSKVGHRNKMVRFLETSNDEVYERVCHKEKYDDNTIFENVSIFKEILTETSDAKKQKKKLGSPPPEKRGGVSTKSEAMVFNNIAQKVRQKRINRFWGNPEGVNDTEGESVEESVTSNGLLSNSSQQRVMQLANYQSGQDQRYRTTDNENHEDDSRTSDYRRQRQREIEAKADLFLSNGIQEAEQDNFDDWQNRFKGNMVLHQHQHQQKERTGPTVNAGDRTIGAKGTKHQASSDTMSTVVEYHVGKPHSEIYEPSSSSSIADYHVGDPSANDNFMTLNSGSSSAHTLPFNGGNGFPGESLAYQAGDGQGYANGSSLFFDDASAIYGRKESGGSNITNESQRAFVLRMGNSIDSLQGELNQFVNSNQKENTDLSNSNYNQHEFLSRIRDCYQKIHGEINSVKEMITHKHGNASSNVSSSINSSNQSLSVKSGNREVTEAQTLILDLKDQMAKVINHLTHLNPEEEVASVSSEKGKSSIIHRKRTASGGALVHDDRANSEANTKKMPRYITSNYTGHPVRLFATPDRSDQKKIAPYFHSHAKKSSSGNLVGPQSTKK